MPYVHYDWKTDTDEVILGQEAGETQFSAETKLEDAAMGAMFGAFIGDAIGGQARGKMGHTYNTEVNKLMHMPGGGKRSLAPGQVTDETEVMLKLSKALVNGGKVFNLTGVANTYADWAEQDQFDDLKLSKFYFKMRDPVKMVLEGRTAGNSSCDVLWRSIPITIWAKNLEES